jgi:hypothetical protein
VPEFIVPRPNISYLDVYDWEYSINGWRSTNDSIKKLLANGPTGS